MWTIDGRVFPAPTFALGIDPAGALYTTVDDLARFWSALFTGGRGANGEILQPATLESMLAPQSAEPGATARFRPRLRTGRARRPAHRRAWWRDLRVRHHLPRPAAREARGRGRHHQGRGQRGDRPRRGCRAAGDARGARRRPGSRAGDHRARRSRGRAPPRRPLPQGAPRLRARRSAAIDCSILPLEGGEPAARAVTRRHAGGRRSTSPSDQRILAARAARSRSTARRFVALARSQAEAGAAAVARADRRVRLGSRHPLHPRARRPAVRADRVVRARPARGSLRERVRVSRSDGLYHGERLVFDRDESGTRDRVEAAGVVFERRRGRPRRRRGAVPHRAADARSTSCARKRARRARRSRPASSARRTWSSSPRSIRPSSSTSATPPPTTS